MLTVPICEGHDCPAVPGRAGGAHHVLKDEAEVLAVLEAAQHAHAVALAGGVRARQLAQDDHLRLARLVHDVVGADHLRSQACRVRRGVATDQHVCGGQHLLR